MSKAHKFNMTPTNPAKHAKGHAAPKSPSPPVKWSSLSAGVEIVVIGDDGKAIKGVDPAAVTTTFLIDDVSLVTLAGGGDSLHETMTRLAGSLGTVTLSATLTFVDGSAGPFDSSIVIELDALLRQSPWIFRFP